MSGPFELADAEFWSEPLKNLDKVSEAHETGPGRVLVIDGPGEVDLEARKSLPIPVYYLAPQTDTRSFAFQDIAVILLSRLEDRAVFCGMAADPLTIPREPATEAGDPTVLIGSSYVLDLRKHPQIPWRPGTYLVTLAMRDLVSNRARVRLGPSPAKFKDPEVEKFLREQAPPAPAPVSPEPGDPFPSYRPDAKSPPLPEEEGIALAVDRVVVTSKDARAALRASFRLAPLRGELISGAAEGSPAAIIPITLVLTGTETIFPLAFTVRAPAFGKPGDAMLTGHFSIDLLDIPHFKTRPQTYFVYAFAGAAMAGPAPVGLVSEDMLPGRGR